MNEFAGKAHNVVIIRHNEGMIRFEAPERPVPWQIESPEEDFVNRDDDLAWLHARRERIVVLVGMSGIGKTALARSFAAAARDRFPGGQLYLDCDWFAAKGEVDLAGMVGACLDQLGMAENVQPPSLGKRIQRFHSRTAERPCLVLLENATEPAQVTALKPTNGMILVTTQADLSELKLDEAEFRTLRVLNEEHSRELFSAACADAPPQANDLVAYAGGMPLAIKVLAGQVPGLHDVTLEEFAAQLADDQRRLDTFTLGRRSVTTAWTASYERLPDDVRLLYRRLALLPGVDFASDTAAAIGTAGDVRPQLAALADAHLLERRPGGRYAFHGLVRDHARRLVQGDPAEQREAALAQAVRHHLVWAAFGDRAIMGKRSRAADHTELLAGATDPFATPASSQDSPAERRKLAGAWFQAERPNLRAAVAAAHDARLHEECWQLTEALGAFYYNYRHLTEWTRVNQFGVESARAVGNRLAEARLRITVSRAYADLRDPQRAIEELDRARQLATKVGDPVLQASTYEFRGRVLEATDKPAALAAYKQARDLNASAGEWRGVALCDYWHARTRADMGDLEEARVALMDVLERFESLPDPHERMPARVRLSLAQVLTRLGYGDEASSLLETSLAILEGTHYEPEARELMARLSSDSGTALEHLRRAWEIYNAEGNPRADELRSS